MGGNASGAGVIHTRQQGYHSSAVQRRFLGHITCKWSCSGGSTGNNNSYIPTASLLKQIGSVRVHMSGSHIPPVPIAPPLKPLPAAAAAVTAAATAAATAVVCPVPVLELNPVQQRPLGMVQMARRILQQEGARGFLRGVAPRMLVHAPSVAISWTAYEGVKALLIGGSGEDS